mgnify:FL=1
MPGTKKIGWTTWTAVNYIEPRNHIYGKPYQNTKCHIKWYLDICLEPALTANKQCENSYPDSERMYVITM